MDVRRGWGEFGGSKRAGGTNLHGYASYQELHTRWSLVPRTQVRAELCGSFVVPRFDHSTTHELTSRQRRRTVLFAEPPRRSRESRLVELRAA